MNTLSLQGRIIEVLPTREGISKAGKNWKVQEYVLEVPGTYPKKLFFQIFGEEKINDMHIKQGEILEVFFNVDARKVDQRWYSSINAWRVIRLGEQPKEEWNQVSDNSSATTLTNEDLNSNPADDLPF